MNIALGADHAGLDLKQQLSVGLRERGLSALDLNPTQGPPPDYPDIAERLGLAVSRGEAERGILICGSGVGAVIAANKVPGVRAGLCHDHYSAHQGVEHDDMNVLVLGARVIGPAVALELMQAFLNAVFSGEERHRRRLDKVRLLDLRYRSLEVQPGNEHQPL